MYGDGIYATCPLIYRLRSSQSGLPQMTCLQESLLTIVLEAFGTELKSVASEDEFAVRLASLLDAGGSYCNEADKARIMAFVSVTRSTLMEAIKPLQFDGPMESELFPSIVLYNGVNTDSESEDPELAVGGE